MIDLEENNAAHWCQKGFDWRQNPIGSFGSHHGSPSAVATGTSILVAWDNFISGIVHTLILNNFCLFKIPYEYIGVCKLGRSRQGLWR